ncbi:MAG TPA: hypothetical protein DEQ02_07945 [Ruminococcaceae bacterium]|nr:hypothetical protein [Oscillospiraceae bacterium]
MTEVIFGWLGLLGGLLTACGDLLLDLKGRDNKKLGKHGYIESAWETMPAWRFKLSLLLAAAGVPLYFLGISSLAMQMTNTAFALAFWIVMLVGATGGFFIHALLCIYPLLYRKLRNRLSFDETEAVLNVGYDAAKIPFFIQFSLLVFGSSVMVIIAVTMGYLPLPVWAIVFTPLCLMVVGVLFRVIKRDWFCDLPGIIMPSLGLGLLGLMAVVNAGL